jgi:SAM-dependent methyltransferase
MEPYDVYSRFYDATQGKPDGAQYRYLLGRHHPQARTVLELACGTGAHLVPLARSYAVEGLDVSRAMLRYARKRLPDVTFHRQSMVGFKVPRHFDAIVCPYDSMNHLLRFRDWVKTFQAARRHLKPGGVFVFDVNTGHRLRRLADSPPWVHRFGNNYLIMRVSLRSNGVSEWEITILEWRKGRSYRSHHEVIRERTFDNVRVVAALRSLFDSVQTYDGNHWSRAKAESQRLFYVCR